MTFAEKMLKLCPKHCRRGRVAQRGFRCICKEVDEAFGMGYRSIRHTRRTSR